MTYMTYCEERGDGLPGLGDLLEDDTTQTVYEIVGYLRPGGAFLPGVNGRGHTMGVTISPRADLDYDDEDAYEAHTATIRRDLLWMPLPVADADAGADAGSRGVQGWLAC